MKNNRASPRRVLITSGHCAEWWNPFGRLRYANPPCAARVEWENVLRLLAHHITLRLARAVILKTVVYRLVHKVVLNSFRKKTKQQVWTPNSEMV